MKEPQTDENKKPPGKQKTEPRLSVCNESCKPFLGPLGAHPVKRLPLALVVIPEARDQVRHQAPSSMWSPLLPLAFSPLVLSLTLSGSLHRPPIHK